MNPRAQGRTDNIQSGKAGIKKTGTYRPVFLYVCPRFVHPRGICLSLYNILSAARHRNHDRTCTNYLSHGQSLCVRAFRLGNLHTTVRRGCVDATFSRETSTLYPVYKKKLVHSCFNLHGDTTQPRAVFNGLLARVHAELIQSDTLDQRGQMEKLIES